MVMVADACDCCELVGSDGELIEARQVHRVHVATLKREFCEVVTTSQVIASLGCSAALVGTPVHHDTRADRLQPSVGVERGA